MVIRNATEKDFPKMMKIYAYARDFMKAHGNPNQWGPTNWLPEELIHVVTISLCKILQKSLTLYTVERFMWKKMITQD